MPDVVLAVQDLRPPAFEDIPLFEPVSFELVENEIKVLSAPSGTGKSVLLKCIANLLVYPSVGKVHFRGKSP